MKEQLLFEIESVGVLLLFVNAGRDAYASKKIECRNYATAPDRQLTRKGTER